ncbi:unnamed protein product [Discula destructiva]
MAKGGYARTLKAMANIERPPATGLNLRTRRTTLARFAAKALFPHKGKVAFAHYPNKSWATVLGLEERRKSAAYNPDGHVGDASSPRIAAVSTLIETADCEEDVRLQLQVMVLETKIYSNAKHAFEATVSTKFTGRDNSVKFKYREWAGSFRGPGESDAKASSWLQHDSAPHLTVVVPVLSLDALPYDAVHKCPPLLREWWKEGFVTAQVIDSLGRRTNCNFWRLARHLGEQACHGGLAQVRIWALQAERIKTEVSFRFLQQELDDLQQHISSLIEIGRRAAKRASKSSRRPLQKTPHENQDGQNLGEIATTFGSRAVV